MCAEFAGLYSNGTSSRCALVTATARAADSTTRSCIGAAYAPVLRTSLVRCLARLGPGVRVCRSHIGCPRSAWGSHLACADSVAAGQERLKRGLLCSKLAGPSRLDNRRLGAGHDLKATVAASETYNTALEHHLRDRLEVRFAD